MFLQTYDAVLLTLERLKEKTSIEAEKCSAADGLLKTFCTKQFMASAFLFKEIFSFTSPLSQILQRVNIDFDKALVLLGACEVGSSKS